MMEQPPWSSWQPPRFFVTARGLFIHLLKTFRQDVNGRVQSRPDDKLLHVIVQYMDLYIIYASIFITYYHDVFTFSIPVHVLCARDLYLHFSL